MDKIMAEIKQIILDERCRSYEEGYQEALRERRPYSAEKLYDALRLICDSPDDGGMPTNDVVSVFCTDNVYMILPEYSAKEIIDKVEAYKEKKEQEEEETRVGDVLKAIAEIDEDDAQEYVVTYIDVDHKHYDCVRLDGAVFQDVNIQAMAKTGKHYKITFTEGKNETVSD